MSPSRHEFRQMAEHQDVPAVADAINNGASRREVLGRIRDHALALEAVRVLEAVGRGPAVRSPRNMARELRRLAEHFEEASR